MADLPLLGGLQLDTLRAMTTAMLLGALAPRINPVEVSARTLSINLILTDRGERHLLQIRNGVLVHEQEVQEDAAGLTLRLPRPTFLLALFTRTPAAALIEAPTEKPLPLTLAFSTPRKEDTLSGQARVGGLGSTKFSAIRGS